MIKRKPIPELVPHKIKIANAGILSKSFATGKDNFTRVREGQNYHIQMHFNEDVGPNVLVMLHTNISTSYDDYDKWRLVPFTKVSDRFYETYVQIKGSGIFKMKIKYSLDNGESWFWDSGPFGYLFAEPKNSESARIYTLIPNQSGTYNDWKEKLVKIKAMGFNFVHLLPLTAMDGSRSPYSAKYLFKPDDQYNNPGDTRENIEQFEEFVEEAKRLELGLCIDLVVNHVGVTSQIAITNPNWIQPDSTEDDGLKRAGWGDHNLWYKWEDLLLINYDHPNKRVKREIWEYMKDYVLFWANYAAYTNGMVRLDNFHSSNSGFISFVMHHLRKEFPNILILAEFFAGEDRIKQVTLDLGLNLLLTTSWSAKFTPQVRSHLKYLHQMYGKMRYFYPINSHDSGTPAEEFCDVRSTLPRYVIAALYSVGYTGMVQGVEYGAPHKVPFINQNANLKFDTGIDYTDFISKVNSIMMSYKEFKTGSNLLFVDRGHDAILSAVRSGTAPDNQDEESSENYLGFLLLANLDSNQEQSIELHFNTFKMKFQDPSHVKMDELLMGYSTEVNAQEPVYITLKPCESKVFKILK